MYCDVCKENETTTQRKAACGCLIYTCDECMQDNAHMHAMHDKCAVCKGGKSINSIMLDNEMRDRDMMRTLWDDLFFDDDKDFGLGDIDAHDAYDDTPYDVGESEFYGHYYDNYDY